MRRTLVVLDEIWDSALTDLGIKIASVLNGAVACAVIRNSAAHRKCRELGLELFFIENPRKTLPFKPFMSLKNAISLFNPSVVLTIRGDEMLFSCLLKKRFKFRLYRLHGEAKGIKSNFLNKYLHQNFLDGVLLSSKKLNTDIVSGLRKVFIPGAVDTNRFRFSKSGREKIRQKFRVGRSILLGVVGRLDPVKGHVLFLKAFSKLKRKFPVKALIMGEEKGVKLRELEAVALSLGVKNDVFFMTERVSSIANYMSACDIAVVPSKGSEMIVRVPLEFMSCGIPVVATNVGVLPEIVTPKTGICVEANPQSIAEGVEKLLSNQRRSRDEIRSEVQRKYSLDALGSLLNSFLC